MTEEKKVTVIASGKKVDVYRSKRRGTWINSIDCSTEYKQNELNFK